MKDKNEAKYRFIKRRWRSKVADEGGPSSLQFVKELDNIGCIERFMEEAKSLTKSGDELSSLLATLYATFTSQNGSIPEDLADRGLEALHTHHEIDVHKSLVHGKYDRNGGSMVPAMLALRCPAWFKKLLIQKRLQPNARMPALAAAPDAPHQLILHTAAWHALRAADPAARKSATKCAKLLIKAGANADAMDGCGLTALQWHLAEARGAPADPALVTLLWPCTPSLAPCRELPLEQALPLLALPMEELLQRLLQAAEAADGDVQQLEREEVRHMALVAQMRLSSWDELLQLLPLAASWRYCQWTCDAIRSVLAAMYLAAGTIPNIGSLGNEPEGLSPGHLASFKACHVDAFVQYYKGHPDQLPLYPLLMTHFSEVLVHSKGLADRQLLLLLPRGLKAALRMPASGEVGSQAQRRQMLDVAAQLLQTAPAALSAVTMQRLNITAGSQRMMDLVSEWVQDGLVGDMREAVAMGSNQALTAMTALCVRRQVGLARTYVDCLLDMGKAGQVAEGLVQLAKRLAQRRPVSYIDNQDAQCAVDAMVLAGEDGAGGWQGYRVQELLAGPLGTGLRQLEQLQRAAPLPQPLAGWYDMTIQKAGVLMGSFPWHVVHQAESSHQRDPSEVSAEDQATASLFLADRMNERVVQCRRQTAKQYGRSCEKCGMLEAQAEARGSKLLRCSGCKAVWYCGTACQKVHWKRHKPKCQQLQGTAAAGLGPAGA